MSRLLLAVALGLVATGVPAADAPCWAVQPGSRLGFSAVQAGAPFEGTFRRFEARICFVPEALAASRFEVVVDVASVDTQAPDRDEALRAPEFFDVARFPHSRFTAGRFRQSGGNAYVAEGHLTIRDVTRPLELPFTFVRAADGTARLAGQIVLRRLEYGVGRGEWADTTWIPDDVTVKFELKLRQ
ncbi:MAG TPA: YceI family protein [Gammaproteobacteria bacterium]|nr:YceI family protein [Gammaproteobacteria bacterium]